MLKFEYRFSFLEYRFFSNLLQFNVFVTKREQDHSTVLSMRQKLCKISNCFISQLCKAGHYRFRIKLNVTPTPTNKSLFFN